MARLVLGLGLSHGPMLSTPPEAWDQRAQADRANPEHWFRGRSMGFAELEALRAPGFGAQCGIEVRRERHAACMTAMQVLRDKLAAARIDLAIILGNDQLEVFKEDLIPSLLVCTGAEIENLPLSDDERKKLPVGIEIAMPGYCPPERAVYPGSPREALALVGSLVDDGFDLSTSVTLPRGPARQHGIPHAFGYIYRRLMNDAPPPSIPIFVNVGVPPSQPRVARCRAFGRALAKAIARLPGDSRVALVASGGLSHFAIDEDFDRRVLEALARRDEGALLAIEESWFNGNTCETKNWLALAAAMDAANAAMTLVDYVPCYRTAAGTGQGMAFAYWE